MGDENRPVLVAVGGGDADTAAIHYGVAEARRLGRDVELLHAVPAGLAVTPMAGVGLLELREVGREVLAQAAATAGELAPDLAVTRTMVTGSPVREIAAAGDRVHLVVVGRSVHRGPLAPWSGRTAIGVCSHCRAPVAVVPTGWQPVARPGTVVVGLVADTLDVHTLGVVLTDALAAGASVTALHAWRVPDPYVDIVSERTHDRDWEQEGSRAVGVVLREALPDRDELPVAVQVRHGYPGQVLLEAATESDLVVLPRRRHLLMHEGHLGSTAREVIHRSAAPVLVLPVPAPQHRRRRRGAEQQAGERVPT